MASTRLDSIADQTMVDRLQISVNYETAEAGWIVATVPEVRGVITQGRTRQEACANALDALGLLLLKEPRSDDARHEAATS